MHNVVSYTQFIAARARVLRSRLFEQFETSVEADVGTVAELMCEDERGPFLLPFLARKTKRGWMNPRSRKLIAIPVVGWRKLPADFSEPQAS
jgi:hypothetical protein